jgi:hypothetical protein
MCFVIICPVGCGEETNNKLSKALNMPHNLNTTFPAAILRILFWAAKSDITTKHTNINAEFFNNYYPIFKIFILSLEWVCYNALCSDLKSFLTNSQEINN